MARMKTEGMDDVAVMFGKAANSGTPIAKMMVYDGARVMTDEVRKETDSLPREKERYLRDGEKYAVVSRYDQKDLLKHIGISKIKKTVSGTRAMIGFAGYGDRKTKKYPNGLPMAMIARSIMKGSVVRERSLFIDRAVNAASERSKDAMVKIANRELAKIFAE